MRQTSFVDGSFKKYRKERISGEMEQITDSQTKLIHLIVDVDARTRVEGIGMMRNAGFGNSRPVAVSRGSPRPILRKRKTSPNVRAAVIDRYLRIGNVIGRSPSCEPRSSIEFMF